MSSTDIVASVAFGRASADHPSWVIAREPAPAMLPTMATTIPTESAPEAEGSTRWRRAALVFLLVLGCGLAAASVVAVWARVTVLNTDRYVSTMAPIARSPDVQ